VRSHRIAFNNTEVQRGKIFRDIAILALLTITIIAGSAVLIGMLWRDVSVAESQAPSRRLPRRSPRPSF
jgi:hypothetical protein